MPVTVKAFGFNAGRQYRPKMPAGVGSGTKPTDLQKNGLLQKTHHGRYCQMGDKVIRFG